MQISVDHNNGYGHAKPQSPSVCKLSHPSYPRISPDVPFSAGPQGPDAMVVAPIRQYHSAASPEVQPVSPGVKYSSTHLSALRTLFYAVPVHASPSPSSKLKAISLVHYLLLRPRPLLAAVYREISQTPANNISAVSVEHQVTSLRLRPKTG